MGSERLPEQMKNSDEDDLNCTLVDPSKAYQSGHAKTPDRRLAFGV